MVNKKNSITYNRVVNNNSWSFSWSLFQFSCRRVSNFRRDQNGKQRRKAIHAQQILSAVCKQLISLLFRWFAYYFFKFLLLENLSISGASGELKSRRPITPVSHVRETRVITRGFPRLARKPHQETTRGLVTKSSVFISHFGKPASWCFQKANSR